MNLKKCPFCGGEAELKEHEFVGHQRVYVECKGCHTTSGIYMDGKSVTFVGIPSRDFTVEECRQRAVGGWNARVHEGFTLIRGGATV